MLDTAGEQAIRTLLVRLDFTSFKLEAINKDRGCIHVYGDTDVLETTQSDAGNHSNEPEIEGSYDMLNMLLNSLPGRHAKALARELIREVEPAKRSKHPYSKRELSKPKWWPCVVRHVTPEHLLKRERTQLLVGILLNKKFRLPSLLGASTRLVRQGANIDHLDSIFEEAEALRAG